jgi:hypothetical protein
MGKRSKKVGSNGKAVQASNVKTAGDFIMKTKDLELMLAKLKEFGVDEFKVDVFEPEEGVNMLTFNFFGYSTLNFTFCRNDGYADASVWFADDLEASDFLSEKRSLLTFNY